MYKRQVQAQTYQQWEMIIVDDCSTDNTKEIVDKYIKEDSRIKYFCLENNSASFMAGLSGAIVEIVSGLYFWMYKETSKQLGKYHKRLEATEKYLIALQIIEMIPEENRSEHYGKLIDHIFENANKQ